MRGQIPNPAFWARSSPGFSLPQIPTELFLTFGKAVDKAVDGLMADDFGTLLVFETACLFLSLHGSCLLLANRPGGRM